MNARDELATLIGAKLDGMFGTRDFGPAAQDYKLADELIAAGFGRISEAKALALEEAAQDFEDNIGVGEFDELARRDGARWTHIDDAWEYQGPYMDWLRASAVILRAAA